jgi:hypothetical protein
VKSGLDLVQSQVEAWKTENFRVVDHDKPIICCVPYRCTQRITTCFFRNQGKLFYKKIKIDSVIYKAPKPKFINCIECNIWKHIVAHPEVFYVD